MLLSTVRFGPFMLDIARRELRSGGLVVAVKAKAVDLLCVLASAQGVPVSNDELLAKVWPGLIVEQGNIQAHVSALRKAMGEPAGRPTYLLTVGRYGYRLSGIRATADAQADRPTAVGARGTRIAVMAFENMTNDPQREYFADGIVEDIIDGLSRIRWLSVIGRNSSFVYKNQHADLKRVGRELDVRYVVQGSVRAFGERLRIAAQLIETATGTQLWERRYDRPRAELFAVQDEIATSVVGAIEPGLLSVEIDRVNRSTQPEDFNAYDLVFRALPHIFKLMPQGCAPAIPFLEQALRLDPQYAAAHAYLAWCLHVRFSRGDRLPSDREQAISHARAALSRAGGDATTLAIVAFIIWFEQHDVATSFDLYDQALSVSPSSVLALCTSAVALAWSGFTALAIERANRALELSPFDALNHLSYQALAGAYFQLKQHDLAYQSARRATELNPQFSVPYAYLAAALVAQERMGEAQEAARAVLALHPTFTIARFKDVVGVNPTVFALFAAAWEIAGLPP